MVDRDEVKAYLEREIEEDKKLESELRQNALNLTVTNILEIRKLIVQISVLSATIIGILIALGEHSDFVKTKSLVIGALFVFMFIICYALIYLKIKLEEDNKNLPKTAQLYLDSLATGIQIKDDLLQEIISGNDFGKAYDKYKANGEAIRDKLQKESHTALAPEKNNYSLDILIGLFIFAFVLILLSVINFQWIGNLVIPK